MEQPRRQIAYMCSIKSILSSEYVKQEGWEPNYIKINNKKISRVNLIATVVDKSNQIAIDDGTGSIRLNSFEPMPELDKVNIGDIILVIGRAREYNNEKYIVPEIIRKLHKGWLVFRQRQLSKESNEIEDHGVKENLKEEPEKKSILEFISEEDKGGGVGLKTLKEAFESDDVENNIVELLKKGEIFEIEPGKYKVLE